VTAAASSSEVALTYLKLGVEHILLGIDHLLFVLALLFFNVGVEVGQLIFIAAVLAVIAVARRIPVALTA
jgi:hypothetical protein